jgi:hypothetical protein
VTAVRRVFAPVRWLVRLEIGIWRSLFLLVTRRVSGQAPGVRAFSYSKTVTPVIGAFIFVSAIELPVVHLLLPWETVRLIVAILSVWGLLWMIGLLASMKVFPHLVDERGLRIRYGTTADVRIPWDAVAHVSARRRSVSSGSHVQLEGTVVSVPVLKQTRVDVVLRGPLAVKLPPGDAEITEARLYVDYPGRFVDAARTALERSTPR